MCGSAGYGFAKGFHRRALEFKEYFGGGNGQHFSGADIDGHAGPSPRFNEQLERNESLDRGGRVYARHCPITVVLTTHDVLRSNRSYRLEQRGLLVAPRVVSLPGRRIHGQVGQDLQQVILNHIPHRARFVVELAAILDSELLRHGDLNASHVVAIADRFKHWISEAGIENVLYRFLSQKMIDSEDSFFGEIAVQNSVEFLRRCQVTPEGLLHHHARILSAARLGQPLGNRAKQAGWNRKVMKRLFRRAQLFAQLGESVRIVVVAVHVPQKARQFVERILVEAAESFETVLGARFKLIKIPTCFGHADDWQIEPLIANQALQRRKDLFVREIAGGAEKHKGVRLEIRHQAASCLSSVCFSTTRTSERRSPASGTFQFGRKDRG